MKKSSSSPPNSKSGACRRRIFIVDDHPITRYGLAQMLNQEPDLVICGEAETAQQAFTALKPPLPHLVVADVAMPGQSIIEFLKNLKAQYRDLPVLILSTHDESIYAERLMRAGARGYIMKSEGGANLLKAIRQVLQGQPYLSVAMSTKVLEAFGGRSARVAESVLGKLTDREFEVFQLLGEGKTNREVARQLCISPKTVEAHRLNLSQKLKIKTPAQLIRFAVEHKQDEFLPR